MNHRRPLPIALAALLATASLAACSGQRAGNALPADLPVVETVNGQDVPQILLESATSIWPCPSSARGR
ncbi:MAG: hypothetical protein KDI72_02620 [Xanthomonadales bacterium]|nr:hypothetical protein [Xanthomonadales bacterium]